jgi:hypothetical protein
VPSGVIKNKEALFIREYNQTLYVAAAVIPALWLPAIMAAGANFGSGRTGIPRRGWCLTHRDLLLPNPHPFLWTAGSNTWQMDRQSTLFLSYRDYDSLSFRNLIKHDLIFYSLFSSAIGEWLVRCIVC